VGPNGLGAVMAHELASQSPALLILTGRNPAKVEAIIKELATAFPAVKTRALIFDISSFASIKDAAADVLTYPEPCIDILVNNAGIMNTPTRTLSKDGFEMQLAVNYLGAFLFTNSIMPKLLASSAGRVMNITSNGYALSPFRFADYNFDEEKSATLPEDQQPLKQNCEVFGVPWGLGYIPPIAYGQSKTAMILYTRELAVKFKGKMTATCCNPGGGWPPTTAVIFSGH
jgi:NAD(P)-dependent dehydrogenase (short-subunit alcohol dehydrogenase family)